MHRIVLAGILVAGFALRLWNIDYGLPFVVLDRRGHAFREPRGRDVLAGPRPGLLPEPDGLHVRRVRAAAGDVRAARVPVRPAVRERDRAVLQGPDRDLGRRALARRRALHRRRGGHLLGGAPHLGRARGPGGRGDPVLRLPAGRLLARGGHGRRRPARRGARALLFAVRARDEGPARPLRLAGAAAGLAMGFKYTAGLVLLPLGIAALARLQSRPGARAGRPGPRRRAGGRRVRGCSTRTCCRPSTRGGPICAIRPRWRPTSRSPARSGRVLVLPGQPHLGSRLGRRAGRPRRRARGAAPRLGPRR